MAPYTTIDVICIQSLSYTGTSWLNAIIGCHPQVFAIGAPDRVWNLRDKSFEKACLIHGNECEFWNEFARNYDPTKNFFLQVADAAKVDRLVINNPVPAGAGVLLDDPHIRLRPIQLVRDGRAVAQSYTRHHADSDFLDAVLWLSAAQQAVPVDSNSSDSLYVRYEDIDASKQAELDRIWNFLDLPRYSDAVRFWDHDLHLTAANRSIVWQMRLAKGLPLPDDSNAEFYRAQFEHMRGNPDLPLNDIRWQSELSPRELFIFNLFCGERNGALEYPRDRFDLGECARYLNELSDAVIAQSVALNRHRSAEAAYQALAPLAAAGREFGDIADGSPRIVSLRRQLSMAYLKTNGLYLSPTHLSRMYRLARKLLFVGILAALAIIALLIAMLA